MRSSRSNEPSQTSEGMWDVLAQDNRVTDTPFVLSGRANMNPRAHAKPCQHHPPSLLLAEALAEW